MRVIGLCPAETIAAPAFGASQPHPDELVRRQELWYRSSKVTPIPSWAEYGGIEPGDQTLADMGVLAGLINSGKEVAALNSSAALWTAISALLGAITTFAGIAAG